MKTFIRTLVLVAFIGLLFTGCSDKSVTPVETTGTNNNPVSLQNGNSESGAWMISYDEEYGLWEYDSKSGLVLLLGLTDPWSHCAKGDLQESFNFSDIYLPNADPEPRGLIEQIKDKDITAMVWHLEPWPIKFTSFCNFLATAGDPLAVGTANFCCKDNNVLAFEQNNNSNVYGWEANGTLMGSNGEKYQLNFVSHIMWDGIEVTGLNYDVEIQLTSIRE